MCSIDYDETCAVWVEKPRTARKEHVCLGCGTTIRPREAYNEVRFVFDGSAGTERECFGCWFVRRAFGDGHSIYPLPSSLMADLADCIGTRLPAGDRSWPTEWAPELAAIKNRWRTSESRRQQLAESWMRRALRRELRLIRSVVFARRAETH